MPHVFWAPLTSFVVALILIGWLSRSGISAYVLDRPNARSLHVSPVPRTGGLGLHAGIFCGWLVASPSVSLWLWSGFALLLIVSLIDDIRGLPVAVRLVSHLASAAFMAGTAVLAEFGLGAAIIVTLATAWMTNLYNFMDGADGLAGGMTTIGFLFYAIAAAWAGAMELGVLSLSISAAAAAFLVFNFHPARIFLGDAGAIPLGFLAAAIGVLGWKSQVWPWWFPPLVFSAFIVDASVTLVRRAVGGQKIWQAHRDHYYQRLVRLGWGHRGTALAEYGVMTASGVLALAGLYASPSVQIALLIVAGASYATIVLSVERVWRTAAARESG